MAYSDLPSNRGAIRTSIKAGAMMGRLSRKETFRKSIHMLGFAVPLLALAIGANYAALMVSLVTISYIASEIMRVKGMSFPLITEVTKRAARPEELRGYIMPPVYFALGIALSLLIFPQPINFAAIAILTLGDGASNVVGGLLGSRRLPFNSSKSLEGTLSGFLSGFVGAAIFVPPLPALIGATMGSALEALPLPISDNLTVPISSGLVMSFLL